MARSAPRMALGNAPYPHPSAGERTPLPDGLDHIRRARRLMTTVAAEPGRNQNLIAPNEKNQNISEESHHSTVQKDHPSPSHFEPIPRSVSLLAIPEKTSYQEIDCCLAFACFEAVCSTAE